MILCGSGCRRGGNIEFDLREMYFDNVSKIWQSQDGVPGAVCVNIVMNTHIS